MTWILLGLLLSVLASAFFSGIETGLYSVNRLRLELRQEDGNDRGALRLAGLLARPQYLLSVFLIGNNLANAAAANLGEATFGRWLGGAGAALVSTLILTPLLFLCSEALPKHLFHQHAERWTYALAPLLRFFGYLFAPLALIVYPVARLAARIAEGGRRRSFLLERGRAVSRLVAAGAETLEPALRTTALGLDRHKARPVQELMKSVEETTVLPADGTREDLEEALRRDRQRRYPLASPEGGYEGHVHYMDPFLEPVPGRALRSFVHPLAELSPDEGLAQALVRMEQTGARLGRVRDREDRTLGFVAIRDLAEGMLSLDPEV